MHHNGGGKGRKGAIGSQEDMKPGFESRLSKSVPSKGVQETST